MKQILFLVHFLFSRVVRVKTSIQLNSEKQLRVVANLVISDEKKCNFYLVYNQGDTEIRIIPTNLDDRF